MASTPPKYITGGCLCCAVRYRADFPKDHDFEKMSSLCMCTQCRKQSGALLLHFHHLPISNFSWLSQSPSSEPTRTPHDPNNLPPNLGDYCATPNNHRYFCKICGGLTAWFSPTPSSGNTEIEICAGSIDECYLVGSKSPDGEVLPGSGIGTLLCHPEARVVWAQNEILGVTEGVGCPAGKGGEERGGRWKFGGKEGVRV